jgi:hypothetical protein
MRKGKGLFAAIALLLASGQFALAQDFMAYEGRNAVHDGQGGNRKTVKGIDFWENGDPPRRYQVIGQITDERHKTGLWGLISMSNLEPDIANLAKSNGGDAVILVNAEDQVVGLTGSSYGNAFGTASGGSANVSAFNFGSVGAVKEHESRYIVVKYLPDEPQQAPAASPPPVAPPAASTPMP